MDINQSYFARTNWFIWIGFISSVVMVTIPTITMLDEWAQKPVVPSEGSHLTLTTLVAFGMVMSLVFNFIIRKQLITTPDEAHRLAHEGKITVLFSLKLLCNEILLVVGFIYGFIEHNANLLYYYAGACFLLHLLAMPAIILRKPKSHA